MEKIKKLEGSVSQDELVSSMMSVSKTNSLGEIWEKCVNCNRCDFSNKCATICSTLEEQTPSKNITCRDVINILLGEIKVEDIK